MKNLNLAIITLIFGFLLSGCIKDNFDAPDTDCLDQGQDITNFIDIATLTSQFNNTEVDQDIYLKAVVTASDESGNIYKEFYVNDGTGNLAISVDVTNAYTSFPVGRTIYVKLNGLFVLNGDIGYGKDGSFVGRIPALFFDDYLIRGACNPDDIVAPIEITLDQLSSVPVGSLVKISGVEFEDGLSGTTYANAVTQQSENRYIQDCNNNSVIVRNSGYADFAGVALPAGNGTITGIYAPFGSTPQILIRDTNDVKMTAVRCDGSSPNQNVILSNDFEDGSVTSDGWTVQTPIGTTNWEASDIFAEQGTYYAKASNFAGGNTAAETWLISPSVDVSAETNPRFKFINAYKFNGAPLEVLISTDFDGQSDPNDATWSSLNPTLSTGNFDWASSETSLAAYQTGPFYIAFKYTGSNSDGSTWEVDVVQIIAD